MTEESTIISMKRLYMTHF